jgi:hypothetical protein
MRTKLLVYVRCLLYTTGLDHWGLIDLSSLEVCSVMAILAVQCVVMVLSSLLSHSSNNKAQVSLKHTSTFAHY